jgi:hypothetical protein
LDDEKKQFELELAQHLGQDLNLDDFDNDQAEEGLWQDDQLKSASPLSPRNDSEGSNHQQQNQGLDEDEPLI